MPKETVDKILDQADLIERLSEIAEQKPRDCIFAWYDESAKVTRTSWFGAWPATTGLAHMLLHDIEHAGDE